jgi:hypothetical protein
MTAGVGESARFYIFDPGAIDTQRHFILAFTSGRASVTPNTLAIIDDEAVVHKFLLRRRDTRAVTTLSSFLIEEIDDGMVLGGRSYPGNIGPEPPNLIRRT